MNQKRRMFGTAVLGRKLFAAGGLRGGDILRSVEVFEIDQWTRVADMVIPRCRFGMAVVDARVYAVGGCPTGVMDAEVYDSNTDIWERHQTCLRGNRCNMTVAQMERNFFCVIGGISGVHRHRKVFWIDPANHRWAETLPMMYGRESPGVAVVLKRAVRRSEACKRLAVRDLFGYYCLLKMLWFVIYLCMILTSGPTWS